MNADEQLAINELMHMARVYMARGDIEKAQKMIALAEDMQERLKDHERENTDDDRKQA
jgi:hypothetical protein